MGVNSFFNPNYSEDEVWDLLSEYLEKKHHVNTSTIQRGIYADINRDGSILTLDDQEYEHATLFCFRNFNFNISGSIIYQLDPPLNDEFDLEAICQFLHKPFPKPLVEPVLTPEQIIEKNENIKFLKLKLQNENQSSFKKAKVKNIATAALYALEYNRAVAQDYTAFHYGQINKTVERANYFVQQRIQNTFGALIIPLVPPSKESYLEFLQAYQSIAALLDVDFNEVLDYATIKLIPELDNIIPKEVRKAGSLIFPLRNIQGVLISAVIIPDLPVTQSDFKIIKNELYTGGVIHTQEPGKSTPDIFILTCSIENADALKIAMPEANILITLSAENTLNTLKEIDNLYPDAIAVVVVSNEYAKIKKDKKLKQFENSELCHVAQYLADNLKSTSNIGVIFPQVEDEFDEDVYCTSFTDVLNEYGEEKLQEAINYQLSELAYRRENKDLELNYLLQVHAEAHEGINSALKLILPALIQLDQLTNGQVLTGTHIPLINHKSSNPVLFQESKLDFKKWLNNPISKEIVEQEKSLANAACNFAKNATNLTKTESDSIENSIENEEIEDIF